MLGDSASLAGLKKQLSTFVPLSVLNEKLKEKDAAHALSVVDLQSAAKVSEERRLEVVRLAEEVKRLQEVEEQRLSEVETLRMNGEDLRLKLKEPVNAHDETAKVAKGRELENEQLVSSLVSEAERVNEILLGKRPPLFLHLACVFFFLISLAWFIGFYPEADAQVQKAIASAHVLPESSGAAAGALPSAASRLHQFSQEFRLLRDAAGGVLKNLWPDTPIPAALHELSSRLDGAPAGIDEQVEMAA